MITQAQKDEWIKRLTSGKYKQGQSFLCHLDPDTNEARHCCLGVLADILVEQGQLDTLGFQEEPASDDLPLVKEYARPEEDELFDDLLPSEILNRKQQDILARANDSGDSFNVIAQAIQDIIQADA